MIASGLILAAGGCSSGRDFVRPDQSSLIPGQTTITDVVAKIGPPTSRSVRHSLNPAPAEARTANQPPGFKPASVAGTIESLTYSFSASVTAGVIVGPVSHNTRLLNLTFWDDRLIFYSYSSGFSADSTNFDEGKISSFVPRQTTRAEVIGVLGRPSGEGIYPYVANEGTKMLIYSYAFTESSGIRPLRTESVTTVKTARFLFDASDKLIDSYKQTYFGGR